MNKHGPNLGSQLNAVGTAVILDFDFLGVIFEVRSFSMSEVFLFGGEHPPEGEFTILLHLSDRFVECRGSTAWDSVPSSSDWKIKISRLRTPSFLLQPPGSVGHNKSASTWVTPERLLDRGPQSRASSEPNKSANEASPPEYWRLRQTS